MQRRGSIARVHDRRLQRCVLHSPQSERGAKILRDHVPRRVKTTQGSRGAPLTWARLAALVTSMTQAMIGIKQARISTYVDDPIIAVLAPKRERDRIFSMVLLLWSALDLPLSLRKAVRGYSVTWTSGILTPYPRWNTSPGQRGDRPRHAGNDRQTAEWEHSLQKETPQLYGQIDAYCVSYPSRPPVFDGLVRGHLLDVGACPSRLHLAPPNNTCPHVGSCAAAGQGQQDHKTIRPSPIPEDRAAGHHGLGRKSVGTGWLFDRERCHCVMVLVCALSCGVRRTRHKAWRLRGAADGGSVGCTCRIENLAPEMGQAPAHDTSPKRQYLGTYHRPEVEDEGQRPRYSSTRNGVRYGRGQLSATHSGTTVPNILGYLTSVKEEVQFYTILVPFGMLLAPCWHHVKIYEYVFHIFGSIGAPGG